MSSGGGDGLDLAALRRAEAELDGSEAGRGSAHVRQLRAVLSMYEVYRRAGLQLGVDSAIALRLSWSEWQAGRALTEALTLVELPGAFELLETGVLGIEQSRVIMVQLDKLTDEDRRLQLWERIAATLISNREQGVVWGSARWTGALRKWLIETDPADAVARRRQAEADGAVAYRRRDDGLADISLLGVTGPDAQACLQKIQDSSAPVGPDDARTADKRRLDAAVDLILGRQRRHDDDGETPDAAGCQPGCGCTVGAPVPCGMNGHILIPIGGALGTTDEVAEVVGYGPIEPDLLEQLLLAAPELRATFVDENGVPVATSDRIFRPARRDPAAVRQALLEMAALSPPPRQPIHPMDHPPPPGSPSPPPPPPSPSPPPSRSDDRVLAAAALGRPVTPGSASGTGHPHPPDQAGAYRVPPRMRRFLQIRRPWCEWPGCGAKATSCDLDHDIPHPDGPTCPCNLGPLCRRHHRIKQRGWIKHRQTDGGVSWTAPTGGSWLSPTPHQPPAPPVRPLPPLPRPPDEFELLSPLDQEAELYPPWRYDDPAGLELRAHDIDPDDAEPDHIDLTAERILTTDTRWTLDLHNPYDWL